MKLCTGALLAALAALPVLAQKDASSRLAAATTDLREMMKADDKGVPQDLVQKAQCVIVVPNLKAGGFIVGAQYGKGFFSCRKESGVGLSAPVSVRLSVGKFGLLIGSKETDVIMVVMNKDGMNRMLSDKFQVGGEASGAAGPVGRDSTAMTDAQLHAEILSYSRSRGLFGGLDIGGSAITQDEEANRELYGTKLTNKEIFSSSPQVPAAAQPFVHELSTISSRK